ncbi:hypothetical protein DEA8626_03345 [Defluviimonas aquaemixtae]|uniref:Uncharacterized protein n=1 Tax=Albidovulum aquaemixtae TaxID=1542388 RepID=A0A2R8BLQ6_9RHOB|nr:phage tail protein [Defluviimonas aquaemixtae]SPH24295.1 hypothetical protein DEA8626_03345 [Defluviimonas aquaemixtae]
MKRSDIEDLLPEIYRRTLTGRSPLDALIAAMEALLSPVERAVERLPDNLSVDRAEDRFVYLLARCVDLERFFDRNKYSGAPAGRGPRFAPGTAQLRKLIRAAPELSRLRGTSEGLRKFLEQATGIEGFSVDEHVADARGQPVPFHIRVLAPGAALGFARLIERIIAEEKPAYVTHELVFSGLMAPTVEEPDKEARAPRKRRGDESKKAG